jgi:hypothetical protein
MRQWRGSLAPLPPFDDDAGSLTAFLHLSASVCGGVIGSEGFQPRLDFCGIKARRCRHESCEKPINRLLPDFFRAELLNCGVHRDIPQEFAACGFKPPTQHEQSSNLHLAESPETLRLFVNTMRNRASGNDKLADASAAVGALVQRLEAYDLATDDLWEEAIEASLNFANELANLTPRA